MKLADLIPWKRKAAGDGTLALFQEIYGGRPSRAGEAVSWKTALQVATVLACVRVIGYGLGSVPLKLYRESEDGSKRSPAKDLSLYRVLHTKPNEWQTSFEYLETIAAHMVLGRGHYSFINRVRGEIKELIPLEPQRMTTKCADDGTLTYEYAGEKGTQTFPAESIWHLKGLSWCGWEGMEAVQLAREAIGLSLATEGLQADLMKNGLRPSGTYSVEGNLNPEQYKQLRKFVVDNNSGQYAGLPMILDRGAKWLNQAMTSVDAQHLETRRFQVEEVCRALGVMPIMVFHSDKAATYASAEAMFQAHMVHTMSAWFRRIEKSIDAKLLTEKDERNGVYAKFVVAATLHANLKDKGEYYARALGSGGAPAWMTQDQVRSLEEMDAMGGDAAKLPVSAAAAQMAKTPTPDPTPPGA